MNQIFRYLGIVNRRWIRRRSTKYTAMVLCVGAERDLDLLTVDDQAFWDEAQGDQIFLRPSLHSLNDKVTVIGYPVGGENT